MSAIFLLAAQHLEDSPDMVGEFWTNGVVYDCLMLSSGKHTKNYGKSPLLMGKLTISMAIFNSELLV